MLAHVKPKLSFRSLAGGGDGDDSNNNNGDGAEMTAAGDNGETMSVSKRRAQKTLETASNLGRSCKSAFKAPSAQLAKWKRPTTQDTGAEKIFPFLQLPPEIRSMIYDQVVIKRAIKSDTWVTAHFVRAAIDVGGSAFWKAPPYGDIYVWLQPLMRTNSQIRAEALDHFFTHNTFSFGDELTMNLWLDTVGDFGRSRIRSAVIYGLPYMWRGQPEYDRDSWRRMENYIRATLRLPNLARLEVERSPFYFQQRDNDDVMIETDDMMMENDDPGWTPDIDTIDVEDVLKTAHMGPLLQFRGLKEFGLDWAPMLVVFDQKQRDWFNRFERRLEAEVSKPKPAHYHERGDFIYEGYEKEMRVSMRKAIRRAVRARRYCPEGMRPRPSDWFSAFAYTPEAWAHDRRWRTEVERWRGWVGKKGYGVRHPWRARRERRWQRNLRENGLREEVAMDPSTGMVVPLLVALDADGFADAAGHQQDADTDWDGDGMPKWMSGIDDDVFV